MASSSGTALKTFSLTNNILSISPEDAIYKYDKEEDRKINREAPWSKEYAYFMISVSAREY